MRLEKINTLTQIIEKSWLQTIFKTRRRQKQLHRYARYFYTVKYKGQGMIHDLKIKWNRVF